MQFMIFQTLIMLRFFKTAGFAIILACVLFAAIEGINQFVPGVGWRIMAPAVWAAAKWRDMDLPPHGEAGILLPLIFGLLECLAVTLIIFAGARFALARSQRDRK
jgi:hypothetical protein